MDYKAAYINAIAFVLELTTGVYDAKDIAKAIEERFEDQLVGEIREDIHQVGVNLGIIDEDE